VDDTTGIALLGGEDDKESIDPSSGPDSLTDGSNIGIWRGGLAGECRHPLRGESRSGEWTLPRRVKLGILTISLVGLFGVKVGSLRSTSFALRDQERGRERVRASK